jgi:hypothetical protein
MNFGPVDSFIETTVGDQILYFRLSK